MTNPFVLIRNINVRLSVKEKTDGGNGSITTSPSSGLFVNFNKTFLDVRSIVVTAKQNVSYPVIATYSFGTEEDGGFTAYLYRQDTGAAVTGDFSWAVRGV